MSPERFEKRESVREKSEHTSASEYDVIVKFFKDKYYKDSEPTRDEVDDGVLAVYDEKRWPTRNEAFASDEFKKEVAEHIIHSRSSSKRAVLSDAIDTGLA